MKPQKLCKLEKGKLIDVQEGFVDTFNWLVDYCNNLKGDAQINNAGNIDVDVSIPDSPVIRGSEKYKPGDNTNMVFTPDESDGKIKIDVYYS